MESEKTKKAESESSVRVEILKLKPVWKKFHSEEENRLKFDLSIIYIKLN